MTDTVILVTTHAKVARYLPLVRAAIDTFWPGHPPVRFLTDGGVTVARDVYVEPERHFVPLLMRGLARLRLEFPGATHVFHMLEDHCPLQPCDGDRISGIVTMAIHEQLAAVSLPTYQWPWNETDATDYPDGLVRTWRRIETRQIGDETLAVVPRNFFRYFQLQPTIWRRDYLARVCEFSLASDVLDPWQFEALKLPDAEQHYVSAYAWPTVHHGFLVQGGVNTTAIDFVDRKSGKALRRQLIKDRTGMRSEALYEVQRSARRYFGRLRRMIAAR